jgi:hypothetical protein
MRPFFLPFAYSIFLGCCSLGDRTLPRPLHYSRSKSRFPAKILPRRASFATNRPRARRRARARMA